jgi:hypothetical protein
MVAKPPIAAINEPTMIPAKSPTAAPVHVEESEGFETTAISEPPLTIRAMIPPTCAKE